jgi:putative PIN family toxin of toxin-antitoxin system
VRRVTLDTNEFVSALSGGAKALHLLHAAIDGEIEVAISEPIIAETVRVLREKFDWPPYDLLAARQRLERIGVVVKPTETLSVTEDEPDNRILECAVESQSEFIVSEDHDLLRLERHGKAQIVTSAEMLKILQSPGGVAESTSE